MLAALALLAMTQGPIPEDAGYTIGQVDATTPCMPWQPVCWMSTTAGDRMWDENYETPSWGPSGWWSVSIGGTFYVRGIQRQEDCTRWVEEIPAAVFVFGPRSEAANQLALDFVQPGQDVLRTNTGTIAFATHHGLVDRHAVVPVDSWALEVRVPFALSFLGTEWEAQFAPFTIATGKWHLSGSYYTRVF